ncbi:MAG: tetratricopeptide repeat protein, partial [Myxococcota bacterium]
MPLFHVLGYEFSAAMALLASFAFAHLGSVFSHEAASAHPSERALGAGGFARVLAVHLALLVPPLALIALNAARVRACDWASGLALYALLPGVSAVCATAAGFCAARLVRRAARATAAAIGVVLLSLGWGALRLYVDPPLSAYDPFLGFFPGPLYDEDVGVTRALLASRAMNLAVALGAVALATRRRLAGAALLAAGAFLFAAGGRLGFRVTFADLDRALPGRVETAHVVMRFDPARLSHRDARALARDHEWRHAQVARLLGAAPAAKIKSYVFPSAQAKRRLIGAGGTSVAKPWRGEIFLNQADPPHPVLRHELAHALAGAVHGGAFGVPLGSLGLIEGLATALDEPIAEGLTLHEQARALRDLGRAPRLSSLFGVGLLAEAPSRSYAFAGSFLRWVLDTKGSAFVRAAYKAGAVPGFAALERDWQRFLDGVTVDPAAREVLRERFRKPSLFSRPCAHDVALLDAEADSERDTARRAALRERISRFDPGDPARLADWGRALDALGDPRAEAVGERALAHPNATAPLRHRLIEDRGDAAWRKGDFPAAHAAYARARREPAGEAADRLLRAKIFALDDRAAEPILRRFFLREGERDALLDALALTELAALRPIDGFPRYLLGRQLFLRGHFAEALPHLEAAERLGLPDAGFRRECLRLLALAAWRAGDLARAERFAERALALAASPGDRAEWRDLRDRARWER